MLMVAGITLIPKAGFKVAFLSEYIVAFEWKEVARRYKDAPI